MLGCVKEMRIIELILKIISGKGEKKM